MNVLFAVAAEFLGFCGARGWKCCVIGGLAVQRWGEPRQTRDVDVTLLTGLGGEEAFVDPILEHFPSRVPDARRFALDRRVLLVQNAAGIPLDISLGALPYEASVVERASHFDVAPGTRIVTCSAEDLMVLKVFAGRPQDWLDVETIIVRQGAHLDRAQVWRDLRPLLELKDDAVAEPALQRLFEKHRT
jgi:hypothetical protein